MVKFIIIIFFAIAITTTTTTAKPNKKDYSPTPYGYVLSKCMYEVPTYSKMKELKNGSTLVMLANNQGSYIIPKCKSNNNYNGKTTECPLLCVNRECTTPCALCSDIHSI